MGDDLYTLEEQAILNGETPPEPGTGAAPAEGSGAPKVEDAASTGQSAEGAAPKETPTEPKDGQATEPEVIPKARFDEVYRERKDLERKAIELEQKRDLLLKLGPDEYFKLYPNEKPAEPEKHAAPAGPAIAPPKIMSMAEAAGMMISGGVYNGKTLQEVHEIDPFAATAIYDAYYRDEVAKHEDAQREEQGRVAQEAAKRDEYISKANQEIEDFARSMAVELFQVQDMAALTHEQTLAIGKEIDDTMKWMTETGRVRHLSDAHYLRTREQQLASAKAKGAAATIQNLQRGAPGSVDTGRPSGGGAPGTKDFVGMSEAQLGQHLDGLDEKGYLEFMKTAPPELRAKHPSMPWA